VETDRDCIELMKTAARVLFAGSKLDWPRYRPHLLAGFRKHGVTADLTANATDRPETFSYLIYSPGGTVSELSAFPNLRLVQSLWAGVETILSDPSLKAPLARMVDPGMIQGMTAYIVGHVFRHHLRTDQLATVTAGEWRKDLLPPLVQSRFVGILGAGVLGSAAARALHRVGFRVAVWSRTEKSIPGIRSETGRGGFRNILETSEILVLMLPATPATENLLNAETLGMLPFGAAVINPSRGMLINDQAVLEKLDSGRIAGATLDVFRVEPLPASHPYWWHPKVLITPHIAADTHPETASELVVENIRRGEVGEPFLHLADRNRGY